MLYPWCNVFDPANETSADVPIYLRGSLAPGARVAGPAIIAEDETTTFVFESAAAGKRRSNSAGRTRISPAEPE